MVYTMKAFHGLRSTSRKESSSCTPGGDPSYERGGDARRKFRIKPLKETDLGVAQAFFDP